MSEAHAKRKNADDAAEVQRLVLALSVITNDELSLASAADQARALKILICTARRNRLTATKHGAGRVLVALLFQFRLVSAAGRLLAEAAGVVRNLSFTENEGRREIVDANGIEVLAALMRCPPVVGRSAMATDTPDADAAANHRRIQVAFTAAGALCNLAMSNYAHGPILATGDALPTIESLPRCKFLFSRERGSQPKPHPNPFTFQMFF